MRIAATPGAAVILTLATFVAVAPRPSLAQDPIAIAKGAMAVLGPFIKGYLADLRAKREAETVKMRVWMHNGDPKLNGCGFYLQVQGFSGGVGEGYTPRKYVHQCGRDKYEMRMTSQSALYDLKVRLGDNQQAKRIELHADGWHNTFVNVACFGMNERTIAGGPRAFCVNNDLLKACKRLMNKWNDVNLEFDDIMMTRTVRGAHKMIFRDIGILVNGFERLDRDRNDVDAVWTVCDRIDLVRGADSDDSWHCAARKTWTVTHGAGNFYSWEDKYKDEFKNPYGCQRFTNRR